MANNIIDGEIRQRQISVEEATTKLTWQRQGFVLYMPKVHKKQLGIDVEFPHKFTAQNVTNLNEIGKLKFDDADVEAITENIRRMHYLAITKYDDIDTDMKPKTYPKDPLEPLEPPQLDNYEPRAPYDHVVLQEGSLEIRVLDVAPGKRGDSVRCHLFTASSVREIDYEALSYVWGGEPCKGGPEISVNDCSMPITPNLHAALQSLRHSDRSRLLWIDAICIDQTNANERKAQLLMMGDIYRSSKRVCIYLGEADEESDYLLTVLEQHQDLESPIGTDVRKTKSWATTLKYLQANEDRIMRSLIVLIHRPWFSRMWVYQEFHLPIRQPRIYLGSRGVSASVMFGSLFGFLMTACGATLTRTKQITARLDPSLCDNKFESRDHGYGWKFNKLKRRALLCRFAVHASDLIPRYPCFWLADPAVAAARCRNPEDKVFGIAGMFDPVSKAVLQPIENEPVNHLYMRTTAWCLMVDNAIFYTFLRYHLLQEKGYPSWILNFNKPIPYEDIQEHINIDQEKVFPDKDALAANAIVNQQVLYIEGIEISTIESVSAPQDDDHQANLKRLWHFEQQTISGGTSDNSKTTTNPAGGPTLPVLTWSAGFSDLISFLVPNSSFYVLILTANFPKFPETDAYPSRVAMQELLGALLFDTEQLVSEFHEVCQTKVQHTGQPLHANSSTFRYTRLQTALLGSDISENARVLRILYDSLETLVPSIYEEHRSELFLSQYGYSPTDAHQNAKTFIATVEAEGDKVDGATALAYAQQITYDYANRRDEYSQRLLNSSVLTTTSGILGIAPQGVHGFRTGDKVVFFREMPTAVAIRQCGHDDLESYTFVGIVQMEGLLDGSIYDRPEVNEGKPKLYVIR